MPSSAVNTTTVPLSTLAPDSMGTVPTAAFSFAHVAGLLVDENVTVAAIAGSSRNITPEKISRSLFIVFLYW